ncbi:hypothetical protein, partial [Mesorhizobium sp. M7A.F.Ca.AU.002.02.1.1]|uniref:hypothetical protein n=1 Tax=Mesorhizobium sp. M7A.F.Ca.AU.002.02.1.1 TaxID=2496671 RepID=UPI0019D1D6DA
PLGLAQIGNAVAADAADGRLGHIAVHENPSGRFLLANPCLHPQLAAHLSCVGSAFGGGA